MNPLELTLGIMTAVGGFVDISELVFAAKAGSQFGYALIWVFALSTIGIVVFSEMSGRVAAVAHQPVFSLMRHHLGLKLGLVTLSVSVIANLVTCAAELGGVALILNYLTGAPYLLMAIVTAVVIIASIFGREAGGRMTYNAIKAAEISLAKSLALELASSNIRVNSVSPGSILFEGGSWWKRQQADPVGIAEFVKRELPFGRFGHPEEVADVVTFLASPRASWISGTSVVVDGCQSRAF